MLYEDCCEKLFSIETEQSAIDLKNEPILAIYNTGCRNQ